MKKSPRCGDWDKLMECLCPYSDTERAPRHRVGRLGGYAGGHPPQLSKHFRVEKTYSDFRQMLAKESLDGAVVAVWHVSRYEVARACLERDLHILLEKPMVLEARHGRDLCELAHKRTVRSSWVIPGNSCNCRCAHAGSNSRGRWDDCISSPMSYRHRRFTLSGVTTVWTSRRWLPTIP